MIINYAYVLGASRLNMARDIARLICGYPVAGLSAAANVAGCWMDGAAPGVWALDAEDANGSIVSRPGIGGASVRFRIGNPAPNAVYGLAINAGGNYDAVTKTLEVSPPAMFYGAAGVDAASAAGYIKIAVNESAIICNGLLYGVRQGAAAAEADGAIFGEGYSRAVVAAFFATGAAGITTAKGQFAAARLKNNAAAGDKVGGTASVFLATAAHVLTGPTIGASEASVYQLLPVELWSSPKAAHYGFAKGIYLVPSTGISTDDYVMCGTDRYMVTRDNSIAIGAAAIAFAVKA